MNKSAAEKAAKWWADQLRGSAKLDNGDDSESGAMVAMLAVMAQAAEKGKQNSAQVDSFEKNLSAILLEEQPRYIMVDYYPDFTLQKAADAAGLDLGMASLPWKTSMFFNDDDTITVSCGYGAPHEKI